MASMDSELQQLVLRELEWDTRVAETEVGVAVDSGIVTLSGTVSSWATRQAAAEAAHRVHGVLDVANEIRVKAAGRTDTDIAHAVRHALEWDVMVPDGRIHSTVSEGRVTLDGEVDNGSQREDAENAIRNLVGVTGVDNRIGVRAHPDASEVQREIEAALARRARREASRVHVQVEEGCAHLTGRVHSWAEWDLIHKAAAGTAGVRTVDDQIQIDPRVA